jgi:predicted phage terminase large subunit-like protein
MAQALPVASRAEQSKVKLVRKDWISQFLDEATAFPNGAHDDQVDAVSGAFQMISTRRAVWIAV